MLLKATLWLGILAAAWALPPSDRKQLEHTHHSEDALVPALNETEEFSRSGNLNGGRWECSWHLCSAQCCDGKFTCKCPGNGASVNFKIGCCYKFPKCGKICHNHGCSRFKNCATCRSGMGEWDFNGCKSCQPGFALGTGDCLTDIDECLTNNGGCEQNCHNTYGSYHCSCSDGHRLLEDKHDCQRLSCKHPGDIEGGTVGATARWLYDSYARYDCQGNLMTLVGNQVRQCMGKNDTVWWGGVPPKCRDSCLLVAPADRAQCGMTGISRDQCVQLGCCYNEAGDGPNCYLNAASAFIKYGGQKPTVNNGSGFVTQELSSNMGCSFLCHETASTCKAFGISRTGTDIEHKVAFQDCHLQEQRRNYYVAKDQIKADDNYDFYDTVPINTNGLSHADEKSQVLNKLYSGCYKEEPSDRDLPYLAYSSLVYNSPTTCINACSKQGFKFAGLFNGQDCYCGSDLYREYGPSVNCRSPCPGDSSHKCGGPDSISVYWAPSDSRYLGCYTDDSERDLPVKMWGTEAGRSASSCIDECMFDGYKVAGVQNGGECWCGNSYGRHGPANETTCNIRCENWANQNCGGKKANAIYRTERPYDVSSSNLDTTTTKLYDSSDRMTGISTVMFSFMPGLRNIVTKKFVLYSSAEVQTPLDDPDCTGGCYTPCGDIYQETNIGNKGQDVTLRFFHLRLSELQKYVGEKARRVYVYTQTLVIDQDAIFDFSLLLRTRQTIIDRSTSHMISVSHDAHDLDLNSERAKYQGPGANLMHMKQSAMCARILLETRDMDNIQTAWAILRDLSETAPEDPEEKAFAASIRYFLADLSGIQRTDVHFIPFYTKSHLAQILENYYERITLYKVEYDRILDKTTSDADFLRYSEALNQIYMETDIAEAQAAFDSAVTAVTRSNATYERMKLHFYDSREKLETARVDFEKGLEQAKNKQIAKSVFSFVGGMVKLFFGIVDFDPDDLDVSLNRTVGDLQALTDVITDLTMTIHQIDELAKIADDIILALDRSEAGYDYLRYSDDIELAVQLQVNIIKWQNLKHYATVILTDHQVATIRGAGEYKRCLLDSANWGEALTRSMVERSEMLRSAIAKAYDLDLKIAQKERLDKLIKAAKEDISHKEALLAALVEQAADVRLDLNEALLVFCQAYYYENLAECKAAYKPAFGGTFTQLLLKINAAKRDDLLVGDSPSTASRVVTIEDKAGTDPTCNDAKVCPILYLQQNRVLFYDLLENHPELIDLDKYRVSEIILTFNGAKSTTKNQYLKVGITSSGSFDSRADNKVHKFLTRPLSLAFEYDIKTNDITLRADVYQPYRNIVHHITPYTTWVIRVSEARSKDIDLTDVTSVSMRLIGSAVNNEHFKNKLAAKGNAIAEHPQKPVLVQKEIGKTNEAVKSN